MKAEKINVVMTEKVEIPACPYCGATPIVEVGIKKHQMESDEVEYQDVTCVSCGLSARMNIWCALADHFDKPIAE